MNMSFGFGAGDCISLAQLAWQIYKSCKDAPESFKNISSEVLSLHVVLKEADETLSSCDLPRTKQASLETITNGCQDVLHDLQSLVKRYESLGLERKRALDRFGLHFNDIAELRARLTSNTVLLTAFISTSQVVIKKQLNKYLQEFKDGRHEPSIISTQTIESLSTDQKEAWRDIRKGLEAIGISVEAFNANKDFIMEWFKEAIISGAFEEEGLEDNSSVELEEDELRPSMEDSENDLGRYSEESERSGERTNHACEVLQVFANPTSTEDRKPGPENIDLEISPKSYPSVLMTLSGHISEENSQAPKKIMRRIEDTSIAPVPHQEIAGKRRVKSTSQDLLLGRVVCALFKGTSLQGITLLRAAKNGNEALVMFLLEKGAGVSFKGKHNSTPLHAAARIGNSAIVKLLLEGGADVNSKDKSGWTPLHDAARFGHSTVVKLLLEGGADVNSKDKRNLTPLHDAAQFGHSTVVKLLLKGGADINSKGILSWTPLHVATYFQNNTIVKILLEGGADINSKGIFSWTLLHVATYFQNNTIVKILLEGGADANALGRDGTSPVDFARRHL